MPAQFPLINNQAFPWSAIRVNLFGRSVVGFDAINYRDKMDAKPVKGRGDIPYDSVIGDYEANGSVSLHMGEVVAIQRSLPPGVRIQQIDPFDIVVTYRQNGFLVKDILRGCRFLVNERDSKAGGAEVIKSKMDLFILEIDFDVK